MYVMGFLVLRQVTFSCKELSSVRIYAVVPNASRAHQKSQDPFASTKRVSWILNLRLFLPKQRRETPSPFWWSNQTRFSMGCSLQVSSSRPPSWARHEPCTLVATERPPRCPLFGAHWAHLVHYFWRCWFWSEAGACLQGSPWYVTFVSDISAPWRLALHGRISLRWTIGNYQKLFVFVLPGFNISILSIHENQILGIVVKFVLAEFILNGFCSIFRASYISHCNQAARLEYCPRDTNRFG